LLLRLRLVLMLCCSLSVLQMLLVVAVVVMMMVTMSVGLKDHRTWLPTCVLLASARAFVVSTC